jgi:hypothetical protein
VLWFRHAAATAVPHGPDLRLGTVLAVNGRLPAPMIANLRRFAAHVRESGLRRLLVMFGPQGGANITCRRAAWDDCYDPATAQLTIGVIHQVASALGDLGLAASRPSVRQASTQSMTVLIVSLRCGPLFRCRPGSPSFDVRLRRDEGKCPQTRVWTQTSGDDGIGRGRRCGFRRKSPGIPG